MYRTTTGSRTASNEQGRGARAPRPRQPHRRDSASPSVATEHLSRQIQDLAADALELNRTIVRRGIFRGTRYRVDDPVASPVSAERELVEHAVLLRFAQTESPGDNFHDLTRLCIERLAGRHTKLVD